MDAANCEPNISNWPVVSVYICVSYIFATNSTHTYSTLSTPIPHQLPPDYPFKPPNIVFLTPSGRFEVGTKVCLSFSAHHPELWQPAWGIRLILEALISFLPTPADGAIGALDWTKEERKRLAKKSTEFCCAQCGNCAELLPKLRDKAASGSSGASNRFQKEIEKLHALQASHHEKQDDDGEMVAAKDEAKKECENKKEAAIPNQVVLKEEVTTAEEEKANEVTVGGSGQEESKAKVPGKDTGAKAPTKVPAAASSSSQDSAKEEKESAAPPTPAAMAAESSSVAADSPPTPTPAPAPASVPATPRTAIPSIEPPLLPWFSDPVVHAIILLFAILVALLYRKFVSLVEELQSLTQEY